MPIARDGASIRGRGGHCWTFEFGAWRCTSCLKMTTKDQVPASLIDAACSGPKGTLDAAAMLDRGHKVAVTRGTYPLIFCLRCGSFSARRARGLAGGCGPPTPAGKQALGYILKGLQPWLNSDGTPRAPVGSFSAWGSDVPIDGDHEDDAPRTDGHSDMGPPPRLFFPPLPWRCPW